MRTPAVRLTRSWLPTACCLLTSPSAISFLTKTGTCFSQSGTFTFRHHPINLGDKMPRLRYHGNADRMAIALSFPFCPCEIKPLCYTLPGRPPRIGTQGCWGRRSALISPYVWVPVTAVHGHQKQGQRPGPRKIKFREVSAGRQRLRSPGVRARGPFTPADKRAVGGRERKKKNILNNKPVGRYQYADNNPDGGGTEALLPRGVSAGQIRQVMSLELSQSGEILNSP